MTGRALGTGRLRLARRGRGPAQWTLDYRGSDGRRRREQLGTDKRVAERRRVELIQQRDLELAGLGTVEGQSRPLAELRDLYLADLAQRAGEKQVRSVRDSLARVLKALRATRVRDLRVIDVLRYRGERLREGVSNRTVNLDTGSLRAMLNWAVGAQLIAENPVRSFKPLPGGEEHQRHVRRALSDAEIDAFLRAAEDDDRDCAARLAAERTIKLHGRGGMYALRHRATRVPQAPLWRALIETGARWGELTSTTWADLDVDQRALTLRATTTKSGKTRVIPLRDGLVDELLALRSVHQRARRRLVQLSDPVFLTPDGCAWDAATTGARRIFRRVLDRAGIERVDAQGRVLDIHALRHTAASRMARNGVPLIVCQRVLGHSSPDITSRVYTHLSVEDLRPAAQLHASSHQSSVRVTSPTTRGLEVSA